MKHYDQGFIPVARDNKATLCILADFLRFACCLSRFSLWRKRRRRGPIAARLLRRLARWRSPPQELDARTSIELKKQRDGYELSLSQLKLTYE